MLPQARVAACLCVALAAFAPVAGAQCFGDDGFLLPGACCVPMTPTLPAFPAATIPAENCCFHNCNPQQILPVTITLGSPIPVLCDTYVVFASITGMFGTAGPTLMAAKYDRTWMEVNPITMRQVWRFLINADFYYAPNAAAGMPCPIPPCSGAVGGAIAPVHFVGSLDYALSCTGLGGWEVAINLTHLCGAFMHGPFSARPLSGPAAHPEHIYSFVGPTPFAWGPGPVPMGGVVADSVRHTDINLNLAPPLWNCNSEVFVFPGGALNVQSVNCPCQDPTIPAMPAWHHEQLTFAYGCSAAIASTFVSVPIGALLPTGLAAFPLGTYAVPFGSYPAGESISVYIGAALAPSPCPSPVFQFPFHLVTGVGNVGGDFVILFPGVALTGTQSLDLANMLVLQTAPPWVAMGIGALFVSSEVWSLNF